MGCNKEFDEADNIEEFVEVPWEVENISNFPLPFEQTREIVLETIKQVSEETSKIFQREPSIASVFYRGIYAENGAEGIYEMLERMPNTRIVEGRTVEQMSVEALKGDPVLGDMFDANRSKGPDWISKDFLINRKAWGIELGTRQSESEHRRRDTFKNIYIDYIAWDDWQNEQEDIIEF